MVQFLEALFGGGTRGPRRMHNLANSVIIFDEIQCLPINCIHLFCNGLKFLINHAGTTAVLCTATQPVLNCVNKEYVITSYSIHYTKLYDGAYALPLTLRLGLMLMDARLLSTAMACLRVI